MNKAKTSLPSESLRTDTETPASAWVKYHADTGRLEEMTSQEETKTPMSPTPSELLAAIGSLSWRRDDPTTPQAGG